VDLQLHRKKNIPLYPPSKGGLVIPPEKCSYDSSCPKDYGAVVPSREGIKGECCRCGFNICRI